MTATSPRRLIVWLHGLPIAVIDQDSRRRVTLTYLPAPEGATGPPPRLSLSMPRTVTTHPHAVVDAFLANLLPDRPEVLTRWRAAVGCTDPTPFGLLCHVGGDVAGAARFLPEGVDPNQASDSQPLTEDEIADHIERALDNIPTWADGGTHGQFSLAGAQAKIALHRDQNTWSMPQGALPTTHILKPAMPGMADQDINEHLTMTAARLSLVAAAETKIACFADHRVLVVTRFDRVHTGQGWARVQQEDFCQALGRRPDRKYESERGPTAAQIGAVLAAEVPPPNTIADLTRFADALIYNWIVLGTDAHAKNYALLHPADAPGVRLAPLYDLNSYLPYRRPRASVAMSMRIGGVTADADSVDRYTWDSCARDLRLPTDLVQARVDHLLHVVPTAMATAAIDPAITGWGSPLPARLVEAVTTRARHLRRTR